MSVPHKVPGVLSDNLTILLYGNTGSGKTAQIGEVAEYYFKKFKKTTRLYTADPGGWVTVRPHVELGIIEVVPLFGDNPWFWIDNAVKGNKWDAAKQLWVPGIDPNIAMYAFEGMTSMAAKVMLWMSNSPQNIGGGGSFGFVAGTGADRVKVGSNNMAHYSVAQSQVYEKATQSQLLPGTVLWTAGDSQSTDDSVGGVVGPQIAGKAKTSEAPSWFKYCFHIAVDVQPGMPVKHVLYTEQHTEMMSKGMSVGMSNARIPLAGDGVKIPGKIEPASVVRVLELLEDRHVAAVDDLKKRLGL